MAVKHSSTPRRRRIGRPPAGADGKKVKDYPQLSIRLPAEVKAQLQALSFVAVRPQWRIIADAINLYLHERSDAEQRMIDELVGRTSRRSRRRG